MQTENTTVQKPEYEVLRQAHYNGSRTPMTCPDFPHVLKHMELGEFGVAEPIYKRPRTATGRGWKVEKYVCGACAIRLDKGGKLRL